MTAKKINFHKEKLAELIVYFASESENDTYFGSTKLNKLLFLADFLAYGYLGKPITGSTYIHQKRGPTPRPSELLSVVDDLVASGRLEIVPIPTLRMKKPVAKSRPNTSLFEQSELDLADEAIEALRHMTNTEAKLWSHNFIGWRYTSEGEVIPYGTAFLWTKVPVTKQAVEWAGKVATELGY